jgi:hypothetical protein
VSGVADDGLIEVANLDLDAAVGAGYRAEIADVTVPADPDERALGDGALAGVGEPLVKLNRIAADVGVNAARHLLAALLLEDAGSILEGDGLRFRLLCRHMSMDADGAKPGACLGNIFFAERKIDGSG